MIKYVLRYISVFSNVSWHCCKSFQGQRSKVKVIAELNGLFFRRRHTFRVDSVSLRLTCYNVSVRCGFQDRWQEALLWNCGRQRDFLTIRTPLSPMQLNIPMLCRLATGDCTVHKGQSART